ncbi:MAG: efflux RND transporter permease subunit [Pseudomonadales bacterium]
MSLTTAAIDNRAVTYFFAVLLFVGGIFSFFELGQLEDPEFTVKTAVIVTPYPGASPEEVELEVTDRIELALQEMHQLDNVSSLSRAGVSTITVDIKQEYWSDRLPQVWDELRRKVRDVSSSLPPAAMDSEIMDDFGDVFGFVLAVTGDGYTTRQLESYVDAIKKELSVVEGIARVNTWGIQQQVIYVNASQSRTATLGVTPAALASTLGSQNMVIDAGSVDVQDRRLRIEPTGTFRSPDDIADLTVRSSLADALASLGPARAERSTDLVRIGEVASISRGYQDPPRWLMRHNGIPALGISLTNVKGANVVTVGQNVDARLDEIIQELPVGVELHKVAWQSDIVDDSVKGFLVNFGEAVLIVLVVLTLAMGWRMGLIIGTALVLTVLGSFIIMATLGVDLQRMSLGAMIIALGMMVDNAIVVSDGTVVRLQKGMDRRQAAVESAAQPSWSLLGATIIAVMAFYPIFASTADAGEYCRTLFTVVAITLLMSWLVAMTITPLQCMALLPDPDPNASGDEYGGKFYVGFRRLLTGAIRQRFITLGGLMALLVVSVYSFQFVTQLFFPSSSRDQFMVDYFAPEGTRLQQVATDLEAVERKLMTDDRIKAVSTFIGQGPPRFYLPVDPEGAFPNFGEIVVTVHDSRDIDAITAELNPWFKDNYPDATVPIRKYSVGPDDKWKLEARFSGPAVADPAILRELGDQGLAILEGNPLIAVQRTDWFNRTQKVVPDYSQERGLWSVVTRQDLAITTKRAYDGIPVGQFRESDKLLPIVVRLDEEERRAVNEMDVLQVQGMLSTRTVPIASVVDGLAVEWEDPVVQRWNRRRALTVQAHPAPGVTFPTVYASVIDDFNAIELPPDYELVWDGEYDSTDSARASLLPGMIPTAVILLFTLVLLYNGFRKPLVILTNIPFAAVGIVVGLLATGASFGFVALLGAMSLVGMMIKNGIVLVDEIGIGVDAGKSEYDAIVDAALSRLRPVMLAAATTVLGVIPLLQDVFWIGLAVVIMAGLSFGTVLTMIMIPVFYSLYFKVEAPKPT